MYRPFKIAVLIGTLTALAAPVAQAQEMTAEDILKRLQAQRTRTLSFVEESKPEGSDETAVSVTPANDTELATTAPSVDSGGLVLTPVDDGSGASSVALSTSSDGVSSQGSTQLATGQQSETLPVVSTSSSVPEDMEITLTIDLTIYFDFDSAVLQAKSKTQLNALCQAIQADTSQGRYQIIGHTDAKGKASYNQVLSQARADEVVRYMVSDCGIDAARLQAIGEGENRLKAEDDPNSPENRRVEVQVLS